MPALHTPPTVLTGHEAAVYALAPWADGVLSGGGEGWIVHWTPAANTTGRVVAQLEQPVVALTVVQSLSLSAKLVAGTLSGDLFWIDPTGKEPPRRWKLHEDGLFGLVQVDQQFLAVGGKGRLSSWSVESGEMTRFVQLDTVRLRGLAYLTGPGLLAIGTANGDIHLVDPASLRIVHTLALAHERTVFALVDAGERFYSAGRDGAIRTWSTRAPFTQLAYTAAHAATVNGLALRQNTLYSVGRDREVRAWGAREGDDRLALRKVYTAARDGGHALSVNACCLLSDGLVTAGDDRTLRWWSQKGQHERA